MEFLLRTDAGELVRGWIERQPGPVHAPHLVDVESAQALRKLVLRGEIPGERAKMALEGLSVMPLLRYPHWPLLPRIWELRAAMTAYDATYVALAEALDATLITRDRRLAHAPGGRAAVELV